MMMVSAFRDKVFSFTKEKRLFSSPCHVLVAVSGGADSMALLHTLLNWPETDICVSAVHIHHGLRGEFADRDERFVRDFCEKQKVQLMVYHEDVTAYAKKHGMSLEEAGRHIRYKRFEEARIQLGADWVATAHTASDRVETTLMRIIRGTGTDGLLGIPEMRGHVCRPLLGCTRLEVEEYCALCNIAYVNDETNTDMTFMRNRIRHQVLPMLKEINPCVEDALLRLSEQASCDSELLLGQARGRLREAEKSYGYDVMAFKQMVSPIKHRMIMLMMRDASVPSIEQTHICAAEKCIDKGTGETLLPGGYIFSVSQGVAKVRHENNGTMPLPLDMDTWPVKGWFGDHPFKVTVKRSDCPNVHNLFANTCLDYDKIEGNLQIRCRQEGDVIHPVNRGVGKSLKKLMNECALPTFVRDSFPVLCDDLGVIMVPGYAVDERVKITDNTKHLLVWESDDKTR